MPYYELHEAMDWAGVIGEWKIEVLEEIEATYAQWSLPAPSARASAFLASSAPSRYEAACRSREA